MSIFVRNASSADAEGCAALLQQLRDATGSKQSIQGSADGAYAELLTGARGQIVVAEEGGKLLGMATVSYNLALRYAGEYCQLEELIVSPLARGKRLGGMLMEAVVDNAKARGCAEMGLYLVETTEHNQPFYAKYGFALVGSEMRMAL